VGLPSYHGTARRAKPADLQHPAPAMNGRPILALDAAGAACSAAVWRGDGLAAHRRQAMARGHAEALMPLVLEVLRAATLDFADLGLVAVGVGPGSFTGIRIALAAARGIGLAAGLPVVGADSFSAVAAAVFAHERAGRSLLVAIDSKRQEIFGQYYDPALAPLGAPVVASPEALLARRPAGPLLVAGDAADLLPEAPQFARASGPGLPDAAAIAALAAAGQAHLPPRPLYLRAPDVTPVRRADSPVP
jgi:tRNA threonylcarbamoyladenosine biosynthesis protein TsaB